MKQALGIITVKEMKQYNLGWPDKFGDNTELHRYIDKKLGLKRGEYDIEYVDDNTDLTIYPLDKVVKKD